MSTASGSPEPERPDDQARWEGEKHEAKAEKRKLKWMVGKAMGRWGGGVPQHLRDQVSGKARFDKFTERAKKVLELAVQEARQLNHRYIGTEHLLLGLVREGEGVAAGILESMGAGLEQVRGKVVETVSAATGGAGMTGPRDNVVSCRIDSA